MVVEPNRAEAGDHFGFLVRQAFKFDVGVINSRLQ